jgi:oligopeptide transport system permease protein
MLSFLVRRLAVAVPTLLAVITLAFFMMRAAPGSPFDTDRRLPASVEANLAARYGFDKPVWEQYST